MSSDRARSARLPARLGSLALVAALGATLYSRPALAHAGSLAGSLRSAPAPFWLVLLSGGGVVGVSFLFSSFVTDAAALDAFARPRRPLRVGRRAAAERVRRLLGWAAVAVLALVVWAGLAGPRAPLANLAVLVVWVGWWAGFTMFTYLVVDAWPVVNPWRTLARAVRRAAPGAPGRASARLPERLGAWPSVLGLLALVWVEVESPVASDPRVLSAAVLAYTVVTVAGAARYGSAWFERVDPVSRVFRLYGLLAPVQRTEDGLAVLVPGAALVRHPAAMAEDDAAFVVALLWVTTYDGLAATTAWDGVRESAAGVGVPGWLLGLALAFAGFACFLAVYRLAARLARRTADTYVAARFVAGWFAPALVPIAAGYHLAHFLGYFLGLLPAFVAVASTPLSPPAAVPVLALPPWFGAVQLAAVVGGHLVAVWVAHARSFDLFPGRLQPLRSQYPFVAVTVLYTVVSLWVVAQPVAEAVR
ncbi:hypothetical protein [Halogeometricum luteum]|uniref:Uncharacterized protein n=1 Tax=Halogeometricum luteum TaxID=2950537 RepID=A0ABU2FVW4_9EURY|nr:hypothetical protein [Halogeometricum sp. S3BR5-2]MDS0292655.1 hypothetical protein [Halogeometricum sp. S3BR5-2]